MLPEDVIHVGKMQYAGMGQFGCEIACVDDVAFLRGGRDFLELCDSFCKFLIEGHSVFDFNGY